MAKLSAANTPAARFRTGARPQAELTPGRQGSTLDLTAQTAPVVQLGQGETATVDLGTRPTADPLVSGAVVHRQRTPSSEWRGTHGFGREPDVTTFVGGSEVDADVWATESTYLIVWPEPTVGVAIIR